MSKSHRSARRASELAGGVEVVAVIGLGYVGLPTAVMFALSGLKVIGVDIDSTTVDNVNRGCCPFFEPGLSEGVAAAVKNGNLTAMEKPALTADAFIIAVPTPIHRDTCAPDLHFVEAAARSIAPVLKAGDLTVLESTSPVGTTRRVMEIVHTVRPDLQIDADSGAATVDFAYSPERIIPGKTMQEIISNDRVIGGVTEQAARRTAALYKAFVKGECLLTEDRTAEMAKLAENTFRDVNIALANELSIICDKNGLDIWEVIRIANRHPRVSILSPGPGVGGHCISVDPWFIVATYPKIVRLIRTAREVNDAKPSHVIERVRSAVKRAGRQARIACLGLSYKADTDDFRESPALQIAEEIAAEYPGQVVAVEPYADALRARLGNELTVPVVGLEQGLKRCDIVVVLVGHRQFLDLGKPAGCEVIDTIGLWERTADRCVARNASMNRGTWR